MIVRNQQPTSIYELLADGDLRTIGVSGGLVHQVTTQETFDLLFACTQHPNRNVVMRCLDAVEKITLDNPHFLKPHKKELLRLLETVEHKEAKWHLAQLVPRLPLTVEETGRVWHQLTQWALDRGESRIVRALSVHALHDLLPRLPELQEDLVYTATRMYSEQIPSVNARIRKLKILPKV